MRSLAVAIAALGAVLVTLTVASAASTQPDLSIFRDEYLPNLEAAKSVRYSTWRSQNPGEAAKWDSYRNALLAGQDPAIPVMATPFGKMLVAVGKMAGPEFVAPPPPPAAQCADGLDNDADGKIDLADPGCTDAADNDETDPAPPPPPPPSTSLACGSSLDTAYDAASPGAVIQLANCSYAGKTITGSKAAPGVVFDLAGSDQGSIGLSGAQNVELRNGRGYANLGCQPGQITLRNYSMTGIFWQNVCNVSWVGGELGPQTSDQLNWIYSDAGFGSYNIVLDGLYVHDNKCVSAGCHYEAIRIDRGVDGLVIRNSVFRRNYVFHIFVTSLTGSNLSKNLTFEGNCFDQPDSGSSVIALHDPIVTSVDPALLRISVLNNRAETGSNFRGPFWVYTGNTFGAASACDTWIPGRSTP